MLRKITRNFSADSDTRKTNLNNNDLIIGASGAGKTGSYVIPYILDTDESFIVTDTKSNLYRNYKDDLERRGYEVFNIDLIDPSLSSGYDPLSYVGKTVENGRIKYNEKDIISISKLLSPTTRQDDPFWTNQACLVLNCLISYVLEEVDDEEKNLAGVSDVFKLMASEITESKYCMFLDEFCGKHPDSFGARCYQLITPGFNSDRTWSCVEMFVSDALQLFDFDGARKMTSKSSEFRFEDLGKKKCAVFINVSDTDRSLDKIVNIFYTQAFQALCRYADSRSDSKLPIPVRIIMDDFASNTKIPDFDKLISVLRSREISVSIILQSISQLDALYSEAQKWTIVNNCDTVLYLGGTDLITVNYIAERVCKTNNDVMALELDKAYVIQRGMKNGIKDDKIKPYSMVQTKHKPPICDTGADSTDEIGMPL